MIRENPYVLCRTDIGLDFDQADGIARSMEITPDDPRRIAAGLQFVLSHNLGNGHTCLPAETLIQVAGTLLEADRAALELGLEALVQENELIVCACGGRDFVFLPGTVCGGNLYRRADGPDPFLLPGFGTVL